MDAMNILAVSPFMEFLLLDAKWVGLGVFLSFAAFGTYYSGKLDQLKKECGKLEKQLAEAKKK